MVAIHVAIRSSPLITQGLVDPLPEAEIKRFLAEEHSPDEIQVYLRSNLYRMDIKRWHPLFEKATELAEQREKVS